MQHRPQNRFPFKTKHISPFLSTKIPNLATLKPHLATSTLVCLFTPPISPCVTPYNHNTSELGIAVHLPSPTGPAFHSNITTFYTENSIEAYTIRIADRPHGPAVGHMTRVDNDMQAGYRLQQYLDRFAGDKVLLGWHMMPEIQWLATAWPPLAKMFVGWTDVQDLVLQQCCASGADEPGLYDVVRAMGIGGWRSKHQKRIAANDAVKALGILSGLLEGVGLKDVPKERGVAVYIFLSPLHAHYTNQRSLVA